jgi:hypothetical protein
MSIYIDPENPDFNAVIKNLRPTSGYCIFIDIVGLTEIKDRNLSTWISLICNTFTNIQSCLFLNFKPLKVLGDGLLFFIPESKMEGETPLTLFSSLCQILNSDEPYLRRVKIGAAYCKNAYDISFIKDVPDIYGKDIDLTARLASLADSKELVMNSTIVERIKTAYKGISNEIREVNEIIGPRPVKLKGFKRYVNIYKLMSTRHEMKGLF